jgi:apolipoprotein N-acyltransferase
VRSMRHVPFSTWPRPLMLAVASGVLSAGSIIFPALFFLVWIGFVPLFMALREKTPGTRLLLGLATGLTYFGGTYHWGWWSIVHFFAFSPAIATMLFLSFLLWNGMIFALFATALPLSRPTTRTHLVFAALLWVVLEHYFPMLVPWQFGAALQPHLAAIQLAEVTGAAGLSFLIVLVNGVFFRAYEQWRARAAWRRPIVVALGVMMALDVHGRWRIRQLEAEPPTRTLAVALVQGNAPAMRDVDVELFARSFQAYADLSRTAVADPARMPALIVWPEMTVRAILRTDDAARDALLSLAEQVGVPLFVGALDDRPSGETLNSAFLVSPAGEFFGVYHKTRLFPFAEFLPWPLDMFAQWWPVPSMAAGDRVSPLLLPDTRFAVAICYEALFPGFFRPAMTEGAEFLVQLTNEVWLGDSNGPWQNLQATVLRAVESRRWLVRAANSGVSAVIAPSGRIVQQAEWFTTTTLHERISLRQDATFYTRWGDWFVGACLAGVCLMGVVNFWFRLRMSLSGY